MMPPEFVCPTPFPSNPAPTLAISVRQPWAWLIVRPDLEGAARTAALAAGTIKLIENRSWATRHRGRTLIHAAKGMTRGEYEDALDFLSLSPRLQEPAQALPTFDAFQRGGIVGSADVVDCVGTSDSPWFLGPQGFVLRNTQPLPFQPLRGSLGFFAVPADAPRSAEC